MNHTSLLVCPFCSGNGFIVKYEASHVYSYVIDADAPGRKNKGEFLSFLYDNRELTHSDQYVECLSCGAKFPCSFNVWNNETSLKELQESMNNNTK